MKKESLIKMNRFKFLMAMLSPSLLFAQSRVKPENLDLRNVAGTIPLADVKIYGNYGQSFFTQISLGAGLAAQMRTVAGVAVLEIVSTVTATAAPSELLTQANRVSNNTYSITDAPVLAGRTLKVFYNGLFQTPVVDYVRNGNNQVQFTTIVGNDSIVTFLYSGI